MKKSNETALMQKQQEWLLHCLKRNAGCEYGKRYAFEEIETVEAYQKSVPVVRYEEVSYWVNRISSGENDLLFIGEPIAFEVTGGSTSGGKLIPYTQESFEDFQRAIIPWFMQTAEHYGLKGLSSYWSISPALRTLKVTPRGIEIGVSDAAYLGQDTGGAIAEGMAVPSWVGDLNDMNDWKVATLYWLICSVELELISVWSPTYLLMLIKVMEQYSEPLQTLLSEGGVIGEYTVPSNEDALKRFNEYLYTCDTIYLWPNLKLISCWQDAMSKPYAERLSTLFSHVSFQPKGLISTEGIVTIPDVEGYPLLSAQSGFYEFIDEEGNVLLADELDKDVVYELILTTSGGLYRYRSGDLVRYEGLKGIFPILRFMGRKGAVSDMVGEKLSEEFVQYVLEGINTSSMLVAQPDDIPNYLLVGESELTQENVEEVERKLLENPQYAYARKIGQLEKVEVVVVNNVIEHFINYKSKNGTRVGDVKVPILTTEKGWLEMIKREVV